MSVIYDIYNNNMFPNEEVRKDSEYKKASAEYSEFYELFRKELTKEQLEKLDKLIQLNDCVTYLDAQFRYALGFKTGLKLGFECKD